MTDPVRSPSPSPSSSPSTASSRSDQENKPAGKGEGILASPTKNGARDDAMASTNEAPEPMKKVVRATNVLGKSGGAYIPPARLRAMQAAITDKNSPEYQRITWEALKKSLNGLINKVNSANIKNIVVELFGENLIRGRGLLCRSTMKAQASSLPFTPVFAALVAVVNTKFPQIGELLLTRLVIQFRRAYKRSDKTVCLATAKFLAHLVNQKVAHEIVALALLTLLLERPTDDSVEVAVGFMRDCGAYLTEVSPRATNGVFDRFRAILHESSIDKRTQYMVEVLFQVRKDNFKDNPAIPEELDLVDEEDQMTHMVGLDDEDLVAEEGLNIFKVDPDYPESEQRYQQMKKEILGEGSDVESGSEGSDAESEGDESEDESAAVQKATERLQIQDETNTNLINLRRAIYLTIMSSLNFEECAHKLMRLKIQPGQEMELVNMIIECCGQERTYVNFYGLLGERFCRYNKAWSDAFCQAFEETYKTIHRFETNRLRNIGKFFAHLLASDALTWEVFSLIRLTEVDTTSSSRIFIKILFNDLCEAFGLKKLNERLKEPTMIVNVNTPGGNVTCGVFDGLFPKDNPRNTRFAINYFTSIGLGGLTEELREYLKNAPKLIMAQQQEVESDSDTSSSDSDSDSDSDSSNDSSSDSGSSSSDSESDDNRRRKTVPGNRRYLDQKRREPSPRRQSFDDGLRDNRHPDRSRGDIDDRDGDHRRNGHARDDLDRPRNEHGAGPRDSPAPSAASHVESQKPPEAPSDSSVVGTLPTSTKPNQVGKMLPELFAEHATQEV
ncbi:pre-mRNA-splicing factor cwc22 [Geranomyces variabilis]|uniref:Pre-mRNA-splicing factor cwc22 n=1 Tax=Geranomyces variabilis TaxID=109894 RepID=A0AAD5XM39_9FUNG|nr:pre-mRNA-splicing factor cwc22 [Geranomyces variabilis]